MTEARDYRSDWKAFAANDIPTKGTAIKPLDCFLALHPATIDGNVTQLLDLGCGSGALSYDLAKKGYAVVAVDINECAVEHAIQVFQNKVKQEGLKIQFLAQDCAIQGSTNIHMGSRCSVPLGHFRGGRNPRTATITYELLGGSVARWISICLGLSDFRHYQ
jgi:SAM-dependent methyltransferase